MFRIAAADVDEAALGLSSTPLPLLVCLHFFHDQWLDFTAGTWYVNIHILSDLLLILVLVSVKLSFQIMR